MKNYTFKRENSNFKDILEDPAIKPHIKNKITFAKHLILGIPETEKTDSIASYIVVKYGDDMVNFSNICPDRTPVPHKDYTPIRKKKTIH